MALTQEALATQRKGNITRFGTVERAINAFGQIAAGRPVTGDAEPAEPADAEEGGAEE
jgi:hypothetical protein